MGEVRESVSTTASESTSRGAVIRNSETGNEVRFVRVPSETEQGPIAFEVTIAPGYEGELVELGRIHPSQEQRIQVKSGVLRGFISDESEHPDRYAHLRERPIDRNGEHAEPLDIGEGQTVTIPPGTRHRFWNGSKDNETRVLIQLRPPLDFEQFLRTQYDRAAQTDRTDSEPLSAPGRNDHSNGELADPSETESEKFSTTDADRDSKESAGIRRSNLTRAIESFKYPWKSENRIKTILIGGILIGIGQVTAAVGQFYFANQPIYSEYLGYLVAIPLLGYLVEVNRRATSGNPVAPVFKDWKNLIIDGAKATAVTIAYTQPVLVVTVLLAVPAYGFIQLIQSDSIVFAIVSFLSIYIYPAGLMNFIQKESLQAAFDVRTIGLLVKQRTYAFGWLQSVGLLLAAFFIVGIVSVLPAGKVMAIFVTFYALVVWYYDLGRVWSDVIKQMPELTNGPRPPEQRSGRGHGIRHHAETSRSREDEAH